MSRTTEPPTAAQGTALGAPSVLAAVLLVGCVEDVGFPQASKLLVRVEIGSSGIEVTPAPSRPLSGPELGPSLLVSFADDEGGVLRTQHVADPRIRSGEWFDEDSAHSSEERVDFGFLYLHLPGVAGELTVFEEGPEGRRELGRAPVDAPSAGARSSALMSNHGVPPPRLVMGSGEGRDSVDILFVPDGFTNDQLRSFDDELRRAAEGLVARTDLGLYSDRLNVWAQDIPSRQSGIDDPGRGIQVDTAFDFTLRGDRALWGTQAALDALYGLAENARAEIVVVYVNARALRPFVPAIATGIVVLAPGYAAPGDVLAHELGHALVRLRDEYEGSTACRDPPNGPNISPTWSRSRLPWRDWVSRDTPLPTSMNSLVAGESTVGAFACGRGFRPQRRCLMNAPHSDLMCQVCSQALAERMGDSVDPEPEPEPGLSTCDPAFLGAGDGCECGCGVADPDCGQGGCAEPGCQARACEFCYDARGRAIACRADGSAWNGDDAETDGGGEAPAPGCEDYDWALYCVDGDDLCDEGDGCCEYDSDDHDGSDCTGGSDGGDTTEPEDCEGYDWETFCLDGDGYCDEGDGCCEYDSDGAAGACDGEET